MKFNKKQGSEPNKSSSVEGGPDLGILGKNARCPIPHFTTHNPALSWSKSSYLTCANLPYGHFILEGHRTMWSMDKMLWE